MYTAVENPRQGFTFPTVTELKQTSWEWSVLEGPNLLELAECAHDVEYSDQEVVEITGFDLLDYFIELHRDLNDVRRKGREVKLNLWNKPTKEDYEQGRISPQISYEAGLKRADETKAYRGYAWWGGDNTIRVTLPTSIKQGYELYSLSELGRWDLIDFEEIEATPCDDKHEMDAKVPSRSREDKIYHLAFKSLPLETEGDKQYSTWPNLDVEVEEGCEDRFYSAICRPYKYYQNPLEAHPIAGFAECYRTNESIELNPFPSPTEDFIDDMDILKDRFVMNSSNGRRPLRDTEISAVATALSLRKGYDYAFEKEADAFEKNVDDYVKLWTPL